MKVTGIWFADEYASDNSATVKLEKSLFLRTSPTTLLNSLIHDFLVELCIVFNLLFTRGQQTVQFAFQS